MKSVPIKESSGMVSSEIHAIRYGLKLTSELGPAGIVLRGIAEVDSRIPYSSSKIRSMSDIYDCLRGSSETQRSPAPIDTLVKVWGREEQTSCTLQNRNENENESE